MTALDMGREQAMRTIAAQGTAGQAYVTGQEGSVAAGNPVAGPNDPLHHLAIALGLLGGDTYTQPKPQPQQQPDTSTNDQPIVDTSGSEASVGNLHDRTMLSGGNMIQAPQAVPGATSDGVLGAARKYLGVPYVYGGTNPTTGLDCSAFVQRAFADIGISLPRVTYDQVKVGTPIGNSADLQPGDLIFFVGDKAHVANGHVGIYAGGGLMIDEPHTGSSVGYRSVNWGQVTAMRRVIP